MLLKNFVGIDISKSWFDAAVVSADETDKTVHKQFAQCDEGFKQFCVWLQDQDVSLENETLFFCLCWSSVVRWPPLCVITNGMSVDNKIRHYSIRSE